MKMIKKELANNFFHAPSWQEKLIVCEKVVERQRSFSWQKWEFGFHVLSNPDMIQKMSAENLLRLIFLIIEKDKDDRSFFNRLDEVGVLSNIFQTLIDSGESVQQKSANLIDPNFDFRSDTPPNKDPDAFSKTLKLYHKELWSKKLPNGQMLNLSDEKKGSYLFFTDGTVDLNLTSDCITHTYRNTAKMKGVILCVSPKEIDAFFSACFAIGGYTLFPGGQRAGVQTINQARGCNLKIVDRFDLTLECIRRQYLGISNPLENTLKGYWDFFELFCDFRGYVDFFLLNDLVDEEFQRVKFHIPFDDEFPSRPFPKTVDEYLHYMNNTLTFIHLRTERMLNFSRSLSFDTRQFRT